MITHTTTLDNATGIPDCLKCGVGWCPVFEQYNRDVSYGLCSGTTCTPEKSLRKRIQWWRRLYPLSQSNNSRKPVAVAKRATVPSQTTLSVLGKRSNDKPGTTLENLIKSLGIPTESCRGCGGWASVMDSWGVNGCRNPTNRSLVVARLRDEYSKLSLSVKIRVTAKAVRVLPIKVITAMGPFDPSPSLYDYAVDKCEFDQNIPPVETNS